MIERDIGVMAGQVSISDWQAGAADLQASLQPLAVEASQPAAGGKDVDAEVVLNRFWTLPMPVLASPGDTVDLADILRGSFGDGAKAFSEVGVWYWGDKFNAKNDFSYWDLDNPVSTSWAIDGKTLGQGFGHQVEIAADQFGSTTLQVGDNIAPFAFIVIPVAGPAGSPTEYIQYSVPIVNPDLASPTLGQGAPDPMDVVDAAYRFADYYGQVPNDNDCDKIGQSIAATAGATMVDAVDSLDPTQNQEGGFWRIAYRGSQADPVSDWQTLCRPGDIVRMGWANDGGHHTTTVLRVNPDGSMLVYDNDLFVDGQEVIGVHTVRYDQATDPATITIYRLTTDGLFLIDGSAQSETLTGTLFDDHILGFAGADSIDGGVGADLLEGGLGNDLLVGGLGDDTLAGGDGIDTASYAYADQDVSVDLAIFGPQRVGAGDIDSLSGIEDLIGSRFGDQLTGGAGANLLIGGRGDDLLSGGGSGDTLNGGAGADSLSGGFGADTLKGGGGADVFQFAAVSGSPAGGGDLIADVHKIDIVDLSAIDADTTLAGDQAFTLVGALDGHAGELAIIADPGDGLTLLEGDVDGDGVADLVIRMQGQHLHVPCLVL